jgi:hypothetical protein
MPDSFDEPPQSFDEIKLAFIYVPHGDPEPTEWMQRYADYIKMPATFVPRARSGGRASPSPPSPPPGQHRTIDGLAVSPGGFAASPDQTSLAPPAGTARFDGVSDAPTEAADRVLMGADPIAVYRRADDALDTAASRHVTEPAVASNPSADVGNVPADPSAPSRSLGERGAGAIWNSVVPPAEANATMIVPGPPMVLPPVFLPGTPENDDFVNSVVEGFHTIGDALGVSSTAMVAKREVSPRPAHGPLTRHLSLATMS